MSEKNKATTIVVNEAQKLREVYEFILTQIKELEAPYKGGMKTAGKFHFMEGNAANSSNELNINTCKSIKKLREVAGFISLRKNCYEEGAKLLVYMAWLFT
jgi:hypothetical protein